MAVDYVGAINIGTAVESSLLEVIAAIESALGKKIEIIIDPAKAGECRRSALSYQRAKEVLGWEPQVLLTAGIAKTIEWSKNKLEK